MSAMNERAQKKNTDCVYFLASPLTCKKGNDCEFRHSEIARLNPRDCWFWLARTCVNSNCAFRHPPLDAPLAATTTVGKTRVPCYYFGQGYCAKGEKCIFMHGLAPASVRAATMETSMSQKLPKPNAVKVIEPIDKFSKGSISLTSKTSIELIQKTQASNPKTEAPNGDAELLIAKANRTAEVPGVKVNDILSRVPEGPHSSAPSKTQSYDFDSAIDKSKQVIVIDDSSPQAQLANNNSVELPFEGEEEASSEEDRCCDAQPGDERAQPVYSGEDRIQNVTESGEIWEESSFDVLVDDGTDQLVYAEDTEYVPSFDILMDPVSGLIQGRFVGADGLADYEYAHSGAYEYELATYDPSEHQADYDHTNPFDYTGRQTTTAFRVRQIQELLLQDGQEVILEREARRALSSNDLRNHIMKRRRAERSQKLGEDHGRRRHQYGFQYSSRHHGFRHSSRHLDTHLKHQEGNLLNGQFHLLREHLGNRLYHGHDQLESMQGWDMVSDHERIITERASNNKLCCLGKHFKSKGKDDCWLAAGATEVFGIRGQLASFDKKREAKADESLFAGPKSLAQIKAEKVKEYGSESTRQQNSKQINHLTEFQVLPIRSQISPVAGSVIGIDRQEFGKFETCRSSRTSEFEGPKSLSVLLKEKHKGGLNG